MNKCAEISAAGEVGAANVVRRLMEPASIEVTPGDLRDLDALAQHVAPRTRVYITSVGGKPVAALPEVARWVRSIGMIPVPHIAARRIKDAPALASLLEELRALGVDEALVIAGDMAHAVGAFNGAVDLLRTGAFDRFGFMRIGVAGYPEGHAKIAEPELMGALAAKAAFAASSDIQLHIVTQFCFDPAAIIAWERRIRQAQVRLPVHVGLPGVTSFGKLMRYAAICGVGTSARFLRRNALSVGRLAATWRPDELVDEVGKGVAADAQSSIVQFHFFPFGGLAATTQWMQRVAASRAPAVEERDVTAR